jgi:endonuclease VIII
MPEGDTVWLTARRLHHALALRVVTQFDLRVPALALADLRGDTVREVAARGKHIIMRFDGGTTLHTHLRMDGAWHLCAAGSAPRGGPHHAIRALVGNPDWLAVGYRVHDIQLGPSAEEDRLVGHLGPDLLGPDWDVGEAVRRLLRDPQRPVGEALVDQTKLAGVGNLYKAETLFLRRVNPWMPVGQVAKLAELADTARRLLWANREHPEQSTTGLTLRGREHWVYRRGGQPCRRCGTPITATEQGEPPRQQITWWCPRCQSS